MASSNGSVRQSPRFTRPSQDRPALSSSRLGSCTKDMRKISLDNASTKRLVDGDVEGSLGGPVILIERPSGKDPLIGREEEYDEIERPLRAAIVSSLGCCLYVSGVPGTGKTATVRAVLKRLINDCDFDWVEINGMKLASPQDIYSVLYSRLFDDPHGSVSSALATRRLDAYFRQASCRPCVLVIDEVDSLMATSSSGNSSRRTQKILYRLLEWPGHAPLSIVAIANTMDLPERQLGGRLASRLGMLRVNFTPYTYPQLMRILSEKYSNGNGDGDGVRLSQDAIEYCARKVGAVSGDARRALSLAGRACAYYSASSTANGSRNGAPSPMIATIGIREMETVMQSLASNASCITILSTLDISSKLVIMAVYLQTIKQASGNQYGYDQVMQSAWQLSRTLSVHVPNYMHLERSLYSVQSMGLLSTSMRLAGVHEGDIQAAFKADPLFSRFVQT